MTLLPSSSTTMPDDVHMLDPSPDLSRPIPASPSVSPAAVTRHSSLAALMNPEPVVPVPVIVVSDDEESGADMALQSTTGR